MEGETLGLVGESGCGKSTTGKAIMQLPPPERRARCCSKAHDMTKLDGRGAAPHAHAHEDDLPGPDLVAEPAAQGRGHHRRGPADLEDRHRGGAAEEGRRGDARRSVSIPTLQRGRRPHQFSGGQCQRISIARAVVTDPKLIICDEPVSALDVSVQAQILNLLEDMKERYGLTLIFIAHDLAVVKNVSDRVVVMYLGKICEVGPPDALYKQPAHPYTAGAARRDPGARSRTCGPKSGRSARRRDPVAGRAAERLPVPHPVPEGAGQVRAPRSRRSARSRPGQFVACHFPLAPGETLPTRNGQTRDRADRARQLRGRPRMRWATMFLFTWVVPPAIVSARL